MTGVRVNRFDVSEIGKPTRTTQGFLRVPAYLTRAGVFEYKRVDGSTVRELRPPDEVFKADSLGTLAAAPVTDKHPKEFVSPKNVRELSVGVVGESVRQDGHRVAATITVQDQGMIDAVERGDRREISCGYSCRIDATPGQFDGQRYDQVQRDITYNHAALGPRNWGRAGSDVALRIDSAGGNASTDAWAFHGSPPERRDDNADPAGDTTTMDMITIRIDGLDVQVPKAWAQVVEKAIKDRTDANATLTTARDTLQGQLDAVTKERDTLKTQLATANDPKRLDSAMTERLALVQTAAKVLGDDFKPEGQNTRQIQEAVIKKTDDKFDATGKSDEYVLARFDSIVASLPAAGTPGSRNDGLDNARRSMTPPTGGPVARTDEKPYTPPWMQPLATSKDRAS